MRSGALAEGARVGRLVVLRDLDRKTHAVATGSVAAVCEMEDAALPMLPRGRMVHVSQPLVVVLGWLEGHTR